MKDLARSLEWASTIVGCMLGGLLLGYGLDAWLGIAPVMLIVGLLLGTASAFVVLYRLAARPSK